MTKISLYQYDLIKNNLKEFDDKVVEMLIEISSYIVVPAKTRILDFGNSERKAFYIIEGFFRGAYKDEKGVEFNIMLRRSNTFNLNVEHLVNDNPATYSFEAIMDSKILLFDFVEFENLALKKKKFTKLYIKILKENMIIMQYRIEESLTKLPVERYINLLNKNPELFQKVFNKHIANYLGITPVSLSRIRKRIYERTK
ncbi:MAG: Crp/Fnr family transcriptional regulator [Saprospiraceae bacterium]|jgi:CRP-like cAMP-binding protein|nr:Crp/Fnr family transcriptional regulator [Saprospiraceae bacterium]